MDDIMYNRKIELVNMMIDNMLKSDDLLDHHKSRLHSIKKILSK